MKQLLPWGLLIALGFVAWSAGLFERFDLEVLRKLVEDAGPWGPLLFVALFSLEGLGVPGIAFMLTAIALWPPPLAFFYNFLGAQAAGVMGFGYARWIGREWVADHLPERVRRFEERVVERGLTTVITIRLIFFLAPPAHWFLGLSPVRFRDYLAGSAIGMLPWLAAITFGGSAVLDWLT